MANISDGLHWTEIALDGDMTTGHDGWPPQSVKGSSSLLTVRGIKVVLVGDPHTAPHCKPNNGCHTGTVTQGFGKLTVRGVPVAYHGSAMSCGDTIAG